MVDCFAGFGGAALFGYNAVYILSMKRDMGARNIDIGFLMFTQYIAYWLGSGLLSNWLFFRNKPLSDVSLFILRLCIVPVAIGFAYSTVS